VAATMDLYFALTSASGIWSLQEITSWQREAGLGPLKPIQFPSLPGWAAAPATKPANRPAHSELGQSRHSDCAPMTSGLPDYRTF